MHKALRQPGFFGFSFVCGLAFLLLLNSCPAVAETDRELLEVEEIAGIAGGSLGVYALGKVVEKSAEGDSANWRSSVLFEESIQRRLGGSYYPGKTNFLDSKLGSAWSGIIGAGVLFAADLNLPTDASTDEALENLFLYASGLVATKGLTDFAKSTVRRQRPMIVLEPEQAARRKEIDHEYDRQSFFSGHASSAFYATAFLNLRLRAIMRQEMDQSEYRDWRWAPPTLLFSWASFVGWTRLHAYKHFLLDVLAGAATGVLMAELFYSFKDEGASGGNGPLTQPELVRITLRF